MKEIERVGIRRPPVCAVVDIAKSVGSSRILRGFAITCPVGNPSLSQTDEKVSRRVMWRKRWRHAGQSRFQGGCGGRAVRQKRFSAYLP